MIYNLLGVEAVQVKSLPSGMAGSRNIDGTFGKDYFDGDRSRGYGGYKDDGRWAAIAKRLQERYRLSGGSKVFELGCAKGFLLKELSVLIPGITVRGFEVSQYAKETAPESVRNFIDVGYPTTMPYADDTFDLVLAINSLHFMPESDVRRTFAEVIRISKREGHVFVQVDAYESNLQYRSMVAWAPIIKTFLTPEQWNKLFDNEKISVDTFYTIVELEDLR